MRTFTDDVATIPAWDQDSIDAVELDATGRIIDVLDPTVTRPATPEERVRQRFARALMEEYGYPRDRIALNAAIDIGRETRFADIVVYSSPEARAARDQGKVRLIVEAKAPTLTQGQGQLASYIFASSADGGVWTNGDQVAYFRRIEQPDKHLEDWTNIPRFGDSWDTVGKYRKSDLRPPRNLKQVFRRCHNAIYRAGLDSEDIALDMVRIILAKYKDEQNEGEVCEFRCTPEEFATAEGRRKVKNRIRTLFHQVAEEYQGVFTLTEQISISDDGLATVVNELQPFRFLANDDDTEEIYDVVGTAFEVYVAAHLKGNRGQYFTNRLVANLMVEMIDPSVDDILLDPACGPAGFLICGLRHIRGKIKSSPRGAEAKRREMHKIQQRLFGIDISAKLVRVAKTNMILNGDGHGGITRGDSLYDPSLLPVDFRLHPDSAGGIVPTVVFTNPPFGASHELRVKDSDVLRGFELGHVWADGPDGWMQRTDMVNDGDGVPPEILFLERCIKWLAPGGKLAIVLARGVLDNRDALAARQYVLRHTRLLGVLNCHPNTFRPFNGTKAAVLFLQKKDKPGFQHNEDYPVFMAISQRIGQDSQGREIYRRGPDGSHVIERGQRVPDHDMAELRAAWRDFQAGRPIQYEAAWSVPLSRILASPEWRFNPVRFAPDAELAVAQVMELADSSDWRVERIGDIAMVFNGPRFKRPFADDGVTSGPDVVPMYTPKAMFEERGESRKYLDVSQASRAQRRAIEILTFQRDWIVIVDSGTAGKLLGRVGMTSALHEGAVGNNNMIRVVIEDPILRDYVYQFLRSDIGQKLLLRNVYGTNQDHIEPDDVKNIHIAIPRDITALERISMDVRASVDLREEAALREAKAEYRINRAMGPALGISIDPPPDDDTADDSLDGITRDQFFTALRGVSRPLHAGSEVQPSEETTETSE